MLQRLRPTTRLRHVRHPAVNAGFSKSKLLNEPPAVYRHATIYRQHTENPGAKLHITRLLHINTSKPLQPFRLLLLVEIHLNLAIVEIISNHHLCRRIYQLSPSREHPVFHRH